MGLPIKSHLSALIILVQHQQRNYLSYSHNENKSCNNDWKQAVKEEVQSLTANEILVVTGSLYFISDCKTLFMRELSQKQVI